MPAPITGTVFNDLNGNGVQNTGEPGMPGLTIRITESIFFNGYHQQATTDASGHYSLDSTGMDPANDYRMVLTVSDEWRATSTSLDTTLPRLPGDVVNYGLQSLCTRVMSSWLSKVCFIPGLGVRVTFKSKKGLFTCLYPGTNLSDYNTILQAASKGRWIHWFYDKKRVYIPWPTSP